MSQREIGPINGEAESGDRGRAPDHIHRWSTIKRISDRAIAPLQPMFVAMAADWDLAVSPQVVLRAIVFSALLEENGSATLPTRARDDADVRWFLDMRGAGEHIDPAALALGQQGLFTNQMVRDFVRTVVTASRSANPDGDARTENLDLIAAWTA